MMYLFCNPVFSPNWMIKQATIKKTKHSEQQKKKKNCSEINWVQDTFVNIINFTETILNRDLNYFFEGGQKGSHNSVIEHQFYYYTTQIWFSKEMASRMLETGFSLSEGHQRPGRAVQMFLCQKK